MTTPQCILLLGPPGSGKSTFVAELLYNYHMPPLHENEETFNLNNFDSNFTEVLTTRIESAINNNKADVMKMIASQDDQLSQKIRLDIQDNDEDVISAILDYVETTWKTSTYNVNIDETVYKSGLINNVFRILGSHYPNLSQLIDNYKNLLNHLLLLHIYYILVNYLIEVGIPYFRNNEQAAYNTYARKSKTATFTNIISKTSQLCRNLQNSTVDYELIANIINYFHFGMIDQDCTTPPEKFVMNNQLKILGTMEELISAQTVDKNRLKALFDYVRVTTASRVHIFDYHKFETLYNNILMPLIEEVTRDPVGYLIIQSYRFCRFSKIMRYRNNEMSINDLNDMIMDSLISNRINFTFEIVGDNLTSWHYDLIRKLYGLNYKIYAMMPVVEDDILMTRMIGRTLNSLDSNAVILLDPVNLKHSTFTNKVNAIYKTFNDLFNIINELHIYDNRSMRYDTTYHHELDYRQDKLFYKRNLMTCEQGMCYTIEPDKYQNVVYKNTATLQKNVLKSSHISNILKLPTVNTCHDIIITNIKYLTKRASQRQHSYIFRHKVTFTRNDIHTEQNTIMEDGIRYQPNFFDEIATCNAQHFDRYQKLLTKFLKSTPISNTIMLADIFPQIDDSDVCNVIHYLEPMDVVGYRRVVKKLHDGTCLNAIKRLTHVFAMELIRELTLRKFINEFYRNDNNSIILMRVISHYPEMFNDKTPKNGDYSDYAASTMATFSVKTILDRSSDWHNFIRTPQSVKLLRNSFHNTNYTILFINTPVTARRTEVTLLPGFTLGTVFSTFDTNTDIITLIEGYYDTSSIYNKPDFTKQLTTNYIMYNYQSTETAFEKKLQNIPDYIIRFYNKICSQEVLAITEVADFHEGINELCQLSLNDTTALCEYLATTWINIMKVSVTQQDLSRFLATLM